jgi:hypothetical protein
MKLNFFSAWAAITLLFASAPVMRADLLEMVNGDRYSGKVLSMSADTVVLNSEVLGKINVPRGKVARLTLGTAATPKTAADPAQPISTNQLIIISVPPAAGSPVDLSAALQQLGGSTNLVDQIRQQVFAGNPGGAAKYDQMVSGLLSGQINLNDLRQQAQSSADQLRELKRQLPEAGDSFDAYLQVLDNFLKETASQPANAATPLSPRQQPER